MTREIQRYYDSNSSLMALVIPTEYSSRGIEFLTDDSAYQQVAYMGHPAGHEIIPHYHNRIERTVDYTCETLIIRKGVLEVVLYENQIERHKFNIHSGDVLTLFSGGHGFNVIEEVEMIEIKQGPFVGPEDKTRF